MSEQTPEIPEEPVRPEVVSEIKPRKIPLKTVLLVVLGLVIVAGTVYAGIIIGKKQSLPKVIAEPTLTPTTIPQETEVSPTSNETANWKIYTHTIDRYSFLYPPNMFIQEWGDHGVNISNVDLKGDLQNLTNNGGIFLVTIPDFNFKHQTVEQFINKWQSDYKQTGFQPLPPQIIGTIRIDKIQLIKTINPLPGFGKTITFFGKYNNKLYQVDFMFKSEKTDLYLETIFDQILSTFKFTSGQSQVTNNEEVEVKNLIAQFEKYVKDRNANALMALFTPAKTKEEIESYQSLMGLAPDVGAPRLFNNVSSNFIVTDWKIARSEYPDNKELITKHDGKYFVTVEETRKSWCNADPCAGTYSFENTSLYIFELANVNSQWKIDKYYLMNQRNINGGAKYEALGF